MNKGTIMERIERVVIQSAENQAWLDSAKFEGDLIELLEKHGVGKHIGSSAARDMVKIYREARSDSLIEEKRERAAQLILGENCGS